MRLRMIYRRLFDADGNEMTIGGIQSYLRDLADCAANMGLDPLLYQCAARSFVRTAGALTVHGVVTKPALSERAVADALHRAAVADMGGERDIVLFGSDTLSVPTTYSRAVCIQHGIHWDKPESGEGRWAGLDRLPLVQAMRMTRRHWRYIRQFENCRNRVCVDYNFQNWYRTFCRNESGTRTWVITNYSSLFEEGEIDAKLARDGNQVRVLFARRFERYRGTRLMAAAAAELLKTRGDVLITFAGDGPDGEWLRDRFARDGRVTFCRVPWEERMQLPYEHDVAVVPSLGSEGTSLSVAEAMAAGCAVVVTDVGGMTSMVVNGFNGLIVAPNVSDLRDAIHRLVVDASMRRVLARNAHSVARAAFSSVRWAKEWTEVLKSLSNRQD